MGVGQCERWELSSKVLVEPRKKLVVINFVVSKIDDFCPLDMTDFWSGWARQGIQARALRMGRACPRSIYSVLFARNSM